MTTLNSKLQSGKEKNSPEVIIATLKDKNIKLSMIEYSSLVNKLHSQHRMKPTVIEKKTGFSLPHIYNLISLGAMSDRMKAMIYSGKIKGTDALKLLRKSRNEAEFIKHAKELSKSKVDNRKRETRTLTVVPNAKRDKSAAVQPKATQRRTKVKKLIVEILGNPKLSKSRSNTIDSLVEQLLAS